MDCIKNLNKCKAACCRWMVFGDYSLSPDQMHYYITHGCVLELVSIGKYKIRVPINCPQLGDDNLCKLHGTSDKPNICTRFDETHTDGTWIPPSCILCTK